MLLINVSNYIRAGSDFVPTPHAVLSGLFGRRPQPFVFHMWCNDLPKRVEIEPSKFGIEVNLGIQLGSHGPGLARDLYLNVDFLPPRGDTKMWVIPDKSNWSGNFGYGRTCQIVSNDSFKLAPQSFTQPVTLKIILAPPFESDLYYKIIFGHEGSPTRKVEKTVMREAIQDAYERFSVESADEEKMAMKFGRDLLGIEDTSKNSGPEYYGIPD